MQFHSQGLDESVYLEGIEKIAESGVTLIEGGAERETGHGKGHE